MPFYDYRCEACGHEFEAMRKISDKPLLECPACGKESLVKLVSAAGFRLKGGGWYETDFKSGNKKNIHDTGKKDKPKKDKPKKDKPSGGRSGACG